MRRTTRSGNLGALYVILVARRRGLGPAHRLGSDHRPTSSTPTSRRSCGPEIITVGGEEHGHLHHHLVRRRPRARRRPGADAALPGRRPTGGSPRRTSSSSAGCRRCWSSSRRLRDPDRLRDPARRAASAQASSPSSWSRPRTWPRRCAPASRRCRRARREAARSLGHERRPDDGVGRAAAGVPHRHPAADQRVRPADQGHLAARVIGVAADQRELTTFARDDAGHLRQLDAAGRGRVSCTSIITLPLTRLVAALERDSRGRGDDGAPAVDAGPARSRSATCTSTSVSNEVLKGIDFHVDDGQVVCVIGPSGSGKSTLLRCVNRLEEPTSGTDHRRGRRHLRPRGRPRRRPRRGSAWCSSRSTCSRTSA